MIRRPPRSTLDRSSAASDVYKRQHILQAYIADGHHRAAITAMLVKKNYLHDNDDDKHPGLLCAFFPFDDLTIFDFNRVVDITCLLYTSPSPRDRTRSRMPSSA